MTLHEAIAKLLRQSGRPLTAREIADGLNKNKWYTKTDKSEIKSSQITARVDDHHELFDIDRSTFPLKIKLFGRQLKPINTFPSIKTQAKTTKAASPKPIASSYLKTSFGPISNLDTCVLILGTMPGDKSLELNEYYGHSRNKFWKIISTITNNDLPLTYPDKKTLLHKTQIGIWDVAHKANRKGSLDKSIQDEEPNDLNSFISEHKNLKVIGFNGTKAEALFDKYFTRQTGIKYISLPSTSPANTGIDFDSICKIWRQILK
jgi:hypoxanthine-DNA glycosylase